MPETAQIVGRGGEIEMLRAFAGFTVGGPAAMVLEGEPGIGKTALWEVGVAAGRDAGRVLAYRAARAEARLSLNGLADLLTPAAEEFLPTLPQPQARTLEVALLHAEPGRAPLQRRALMAAVLAALRSLVSVCPVLLAIDDLQWLDVSTAEALGFAMRRLDGAPIRLLTTVRVPGQTPAIDIAADLGAGKVRRVTVGPLPVEATGTILRTVVPSLSVPTVRRLHDAARGNPLYASELARWLPPGGLPVDEPLHVPPSMRDLVRRRLAAMPEETRHALLLAAAAPNPRLDRLASNADSSSIERDLAPAVAGGIVELDGDLVLFAHPLWAAAAYAAASTGRRRAAHRRLAEGHCGTEERARHLALAAEGPDEAVAAAMAAAAEHARARGASWPAAELASHAARLSPDSQVRYDRAVTAAEYLFGAGDAAGARHSLETLLGEAPANHARARALLALGRVRMHELDFRQVSSILHQALECAEGDHVLESEIQVLLAFQSDDDFPAGLAHARAAVNLLSGAGNPAALARALSAEMAMRDMCRGAVPSTLIKRALAAEKRAAPARVRDRPSYRLGICLRSTGDAPAAVVRLRAALAAVDAEQDEASRSEVLVSLVRAELLAGEWDAAQRHAAEAIDALMLPEQRAAEQILRALQAELDALRGRLAQAQAAAEQVLRESASAGAVIAPVFALATLGFAALCQDAPVLAVSYLEQADELALSQRQGGPGNFPYHGDYAEALIGAGELSRAAGVIGRLRVHGEKLGRPWPLAVADRCHALLCASTGDADGAIAAAQSALDRHEQLAIPFESGRALLVAGGIHRRVKHKRQAADQLDQAATIFEKLGAPLWSARARAELSRVGLRAGSRSALTQTERQVAALVAQGLSNREVAGRLFVSLRTVESNLSRIYRKLGVRSRTEMARAMAVRK